MEFFAGANTRYGFKSIFEDVLNNIERVYILKGSSGCGKSTLMRRIADKGESLGFNIDYIFCSADPKSLDGIIVNEKNFAIIDGTTPHIMDVKYPCVRENIINLGSFWDETKLIPKRSEIIHLTDLKSCHYKNAYRALAAVGNLAELEQELIFQCCDGDKTDKIAFKLCEKLVGLKGKHKKIYSSSFSSKGFSNLKSFSNLNTVYSINGLGAEVLMNSIAHIAYETGESHISAINVIDPNTTDAIYFPYTNSLIVKNNWDCFDNAKETHTIATTRYISKTKSSSIRNRLNALEKLESELLFEAKKELGEAKIIHDEIENIYIPAMDFSAMDQYILSLSKSVFGE